MLTSVVSAIVVSYVLSRSVETIPARPILVVSIVLGASTTFVLRRSTPERGSLGAVLGVVVTILAWLSWRAWPDLLPLGGESDLTHHLQLVGYIEQHWRLPSDPGAFTQIGNMVNYTPGVHLLAAMAGAWTGTDGLHTIQSVLAALVALKAAVLFLIVRRILPRDGPRALPSICSVLLLFLPYDFFIGSFTHFSFLAQVASEAFAVAMWWALVLWDEHPAGRAAVLFAITGTGAFLTWPIWTGPPVLVLMIVILARKELPRATRIRHAALALGPIAAVAVLHTIGRVQATEIVTTGGAVFRPSVARIGWVFLVLSVAGLWLAIRDRAYRITVLVLGAIAVQTVGLFVAARAGGADTPYLAIKMAHLALYPLAACGALALAAMSRWVPLWPAQGSGPVVSAFRRSLRRLKPAPTKDVLLAQSVALVLMLALAADVTRELSSIRPRPPAITEDLFRAGAWARTHVQPACVEYLVPQDATSYWLHLAVLGNPSVRPPGTSPPGLVFRDAVARWITGTSLPFAIADLGAVPRDVREELDVLARFGNAVVARRRGASSCPPR